MSRPRPFSRIAAAVVVLATAYACWVPDLEWLDGKACDDDHPCIRGVCLVGQCVVSPPGKDASTPVVVTRALLHVLEDGGVVAVPETPAAVSVLVETAGGHVNLTPTVEDAGLMVFWDVPPGGEYMVRLGSRYFVSDAGLVDLGERVPGRADLTAPPPGTTLRTELDCMAPWEAADEIWLTAAGAGIPGLPLSALPGWVAPAAGSGQLRTTQPWTGPLTPGVIRSSRGDRAIYTQMEYRAVTAIVTDGGSTPVEMWLATRAASDKDLDMAEGAETIFRDCIHGTALKNQPGVVVYGSHFASYLEDLGAGATVSDLTLTVGPVLWPAGPGPQLSRTKWSTLDDLYGFTTLPDQDPYPPEWTRQANLVMVAVVPVPLQLQTDGGTTTAFEQAIIASRRAFTLDGGDLAPALSPPQAVRVNGMPAANGVTGAGMQPVIAWDPPVLGTPAAYEISVLREQDPSRQKAPRLEGTIWTKDTRVRLPPGFFAPRSSYVLRIRAVAAPLDLPRAPLRAGLPYDEAATVTGLIEP